MFDKVKKFINGKTLSAEILRFVLVGGIATVIDFLVMALTLYLFAPENYPDFLSIFAGGSPTPLAAAVGTGAGFLAGLAANYFLSVVFVYNEEGKSKTIKGFLLFAVLSAVGLAVHEAGMYLFYTVLRINEWIVKIFLTTVVLVYNYLTRKIFIFRKAGGEKPENDEEETR